MDIEMDTYPPEVDTVDSSTTSATRGYSNKNHVDVEYQTEVHLRAGIQKRKTWKSTMFRILIGTIVTMMIVAVMAVTIKTFSTDPDGSDVDTILLGGGHGTTPERIVVATDTTTGDEWAIPIVDVHTAGRYGICASGAITFGAASVVHGDVGVVVGAATIEGSVVTGEYEFQTTNAVQAMEYIHAARKDALGRNRSTGTEFGITAVSLSGMILGPGVYDTVGAVTVTANTLLTFDGQDDPHAVWIIRIKGAFTLGAGARMIMRNGGCPGNVYFTVNGAVTYGANSAVVGTSIALGAATTGAYVRSGPLLSTHGAITLGAQNTIQTYCRVGDAENTSGMCQQIQGCPMTPPPTATPTTATPTTPAPTTPAPTTPAPTTPAPTTPAPTTPAPTTPAPTTPAPTTPAPTTPAPPTPAPPTTAPPTAVPVRTWILGPQSTTIMIAPVDASCMSIAVGVRSIEASGLERWTEQDEAIFNSNTDRHRFRWEIWYTKVDDPMSWYQHQMFWDDVKGCMEHAYSTSIYADGAYAVTYTTWYTHCTFAGDTVPPDGDYSFDNSYDACVPGTQSFANMGGVMTIKAPMAVSVYMQEFNTCRLKHEITEFLVELDTEGSLTRTRVPVDYLPPSASVSINIRSVAAANSTQLWTEEDTPEQISLNMDIWFKLAGDDGLSHYQMNWPNNPNYGEEPLICAEHTVVYSDYTVVVWKTDCSPSTSVVPIPSSISMDIGDCVPGVPMYTFVNGEISVRNHPDVIVSVESLEYCPE
jgi:hypothetical protein